MPVFRLRYSQTIDLSKMLSELRQQRDGSDEAIELLARLAAGGVNVVDGRQFGCRWSKGVAVR
jgi:hypothetical protein